MRGLRKRSRYARRRGVLASRFSGLMSPASLAGPPVDPAIRRRRIAWLLPLLAVPLLLLLFANWPEDDESAVAEPEEPSGVAGWVLDGPRGPQCLRLVIANDVSGSMKTYAAARDQAMTALLDWLPKNLRGDDELAVVDFAETAVTKLSPTQASTLVPGGAIGGAGAIEGGSTLLAPVLAEMDSWARSSCHIALLLLSDAQVTLSAENSTRTSLPSDADGGSQLAQQHHIKDIRLLVPDPDIDVPSEWEATFPAAAPQRFDGFNADETAKAIATTIAGLTGQNLVR